MNAGVDIRKKLEDRDKQILDLRKKLESYANQEKEMQDTICWLSEKTKVIARCSSCR